MWSASSRGRSPADTLSPVQARAQRKAETLTKVANLGHVLLERFAVGTFLDPAAPVPIAVQIPKRRRSATSEIPQSESPARGPNLQHIHRLADRPDRLIPSIFILHLHQPVRPLERLGPDPTRCNSVIHVQHGEARLGDAGMRSVDVVGRNRVAQRGPVDRFVRLRVELLLRGVVGPPHEVSTRQKLSSHISVREHRRNCWQRCKR